MKINKNLTRVFLFFIFAFAVGSFLLPDGDFSPRENRYLAQWPTFAAADILSGKFMSRVDAYITDQFPLRDAWILLRADVERLLHKQEHKGLYFARDGFLLEYFRADPHWLLRNTGYVNAFAERLGLPTALMLVPTSTAIYPEKMPRGAKSDDQALAWQLVKDNLADPVQAIEIYETLKEHKEQDIYFRTDHHWTMRGAYWAYRAWSRAQEEPALPLSLLQSRIVSQDFFGTYYAKVARRGQRADRIEVLEPLPAPAIEAFYPSSQEVRESFYDASYLEKVDKYAYFLGGNHGLIRIETEAKNDRSLLLIKDSYAHCFVPFLAEHYGRIHVVDLRYYSLSVKEYAELNNCDEVLLLFSLAQFAMPAQLHKLGL